MKGTKEDVKRQKHSQKSDEGCVPSSQESHPSSSLFDIEQVNPSSSPKCPDCILEWILVQSPFEGIAYCPGCGGWFTI